MAAAALYDPKCKWEEDSQWGRTRGTIEGRQNVYFNVNIKDISKSKIYDIYDICFLDGTLRDNDNDGYVRFYDDSAARKYPLDMWPTAFQEAVKRRRIAEGRVPPSTTGKYRSLFSSTTNGSSVDPLAGLTVSNGKSIFNKTPSTKPSSLFLEDPTNKSGGARRRRQTKRRHRTKRRQQSRSRK